MSENEFESLLDTLHGKVIAAQTQAEIMPESDEITNEEFEALLDEINARKESAPAINWRGCRTFKIIRL